MKDYRKKNEKTIKDAFSRLRNNANKVFHESLVEMCKQAMDYALNKHDEYHRKHVERGDSYGWMVLHNKKVKDFGVNAKNDQSRIDFGNYMQTNIPAEIPNGWVGCVVAGMKVVGYFVVNYETDILNDTIDFVKQNYVSIAKGVKI